MECGQPALSLRRRRLQSDYAVKIQSDRVHPTASIMKYGWQNIYATYQPDREPFDTKVKKALNALDAINVADVPQVPLETAPWIQQPPTAKSAQAHLKPIFRQIADVMTSHWPTAWDNEETEAFYRHLQSDAGYKIKYHIQPRLKDTTITRLRLGHSKTNAGLHKIRLRDNADCAICRTPKTTEYFLLTCSVQQQLQDQLRRECIRINRPYDINTVLATTSCTDVIYDWIVSSKRQL